MINLYFFGRPWIYIQGIGQLTFYRFFNNRAIEDLAKRPSIGSLVLLGFELTTYQSAGHCHNL